LSALLNEKDKKIKGLALEILALRKKLLEAENYVAAEDDKFSVYLYEELVIKRGNVVNELVNALILIGL
jgi:hypothetical protein